MKSNDSKPTMQQVIKENVQKLISQLEAGHSEAMTAYLGAMAHFHKYSFGNILMVVSQKPEATRVAGFHAWRELGRHVKKGEKGIAILAPLVGKRRNEEAEPSAEGEQSKAFIYGFRRVYVWDVSQTEGEPLPAFGETTGEVGESLDRLKAFIAAQGIELVFDASIAPALGMSYGGKIAILPGQSEAETFACLAHEAAHEILHKKERRAGTTKTQRETEAEAVAFIVASAIGLNAASSSDYIQLYNGNAESLAESLEVVQQAASVILAAIDTKKQSEADERAA